jgi:uncharacterized protein YvpB
LKSVLRALVIATVVIGSFMGLMEIKGQSLSGKKLHKTVFIETNDDWKKCKFDNCALQGKTNSIAFLNFDKPAELVSNIISPGFPFKQLIFSWNASKLDSLEILQFEVEVSPDSNTWEKFSYQTWGAQIESAWQYESVKEIKGIGKMNVDVLSLEKPMQFARVRVRALGTTGAGEIILRRVALSFSSDNVTWDDYSKNQRDIKAEFGKIKLAVPYFTQRNLPPSISGSCCSPTSVSMVLNYYGREIEPEQFAYQAYDSRGQIYGNWPHNMAAAFACGLGKTWIASHSSFDEIYDEVASGKPVVISVAYGYDELPHSPIHEALDGHLIVVVGFDGPNTVICNDPAGHGVEDGIVNYPRYELEKIWLDHGGIAYHLWPE